VVTLECGAERHLLLSHHSFITDKPPPQAIPSVAGWQALLTL